MKVDLVTAQLATEEHCTHCFDVLVAHFTGEEVPKPDFAPATCPLFVTWSKDRGRGAEPRLRGCIGTLEPTTLPRGLTEFALTSALRDRRFPPIAASEVPELHCGVSLLHSYESDLAWNSWEVGKHGIVIRFPDPVTKQQLQATFLPEIAEREGWDHATTLEHLIRKAGCRSPITPQLLDSVSLTRYQSSYCTMEYGEYQKRSRLASVRGDALQEKEGGTQGAVNAIKKAFCF